MISAFTSLLLACLAVAVSALIAVWTCDCGFIPLRKFAAFVRRPMVEIVLVAAIALGFIRHGATKGTNGMGENGEWRIENGELDGGLRSLPPELAAMSNALAVTDFAVDISNKTVVFETTWASNIFDYTDSRNLFLFSSTNLLEDRWTPLGAFLMPSGTNSCTFTVTTNDVDAIALPWFLDSLGGIGFYRFGADVDSDNDGLTDSHERLWTFTDPEEYDTDGDWLSDGYEASVGTDPLLPDTDGDGLSDGYEDSLGSDPLSADTDGDGLSDGDEVLVHGTDPSLPDTDGDGLSDSAEISVRHTDPTAPDTDGDGLSDGEEVFMGTSPLRADTDSDGMPDGWEVVNALNPLEDDAGADADGDDLSNIGEKKRSLLPVGCSVADLLNFTSELGTHHRNLLRDTGPLNAFHGRMLAKSFDLEDMYKNSVRARDFHLKRVHFTEGVSR